MANLNTVEFIPVGGVHDRAIDGLERCHQNKNAESCIYQLSIEVDYKNKINKTIKALKKNKIKFSKLTYMTNQKVSKPDLLIDQIFNIHSVHLYIMDIDAIAFRVNYNSGTQAIFHTFVESYLHKFEKPGSEYAVCDFIKDPRLYTFLQQQVTDMSVNTRTDEFLADTLILFSLEDTDPKLEKAMSKDEIKNAISKVFSFNADRILKKISDRISILSEKPRKIKFDSRFCGYILPYETRVEINEKNLKNRIIYEDFCRDSLKKLKAYLKNEDVGVKDCQSLIEKSIHKIYFQQGLEFSQLIVKGESKEMFEKDLPSVISQVVEESSVIPKNKNKVKSALLLCIREIVYNGTDGEKKFLFALSQTYTMLFLLQCDPKISSFFEAMASNLNLYVCASIIIPALSEFYLEPRNKRYWALLKGARNSGVRLVVNESIIDEIVCHFRHIKNQYYTEYNGDDDFFSENDISTLYVKEILLRSLTLRTQSHEYELISFKW